jgi:multidrug efflux pump subunit AcrB
MIGFFVRKHAAVFSFVVLIVIVGVMAYLGLPRESSPEIKQPYVFVTTLYPGVSAKDIENLVTRPIEEEIDGLDGIRALTSTSQQSFSFVMVEFTSDITVETAVRRVRERVDIAKTELPNDVEEPAVQELSSSSWPILVISLTHPEGLKVIDQAADRVEEELKTIKGVLEVNVAGKLDREVAIELDPVKLEHYGFSLNDVSGAIQSEHVTIPGGFLKTASKNFTIDVTGEIKDPAVFEKIMINVDDVNVPLSEVGSARFTWAEPETYSRVNGLPAISISISKRSGENIVDIVDEARVIMDQIESELPEGTVVVMSQDQSEHIRDMVLDLENNIFSGLILVLLVTFFFLGSVNALFVSLAIPLSMLMSFFILQMMGITLNMVVLFSLVLALGMLVDNGIVVVENIFRHASMGKSRMQAAVDGAGEVAMPIIASTLTTCLGFFPVIFMPGVMGDFMSFVPKTVIVVLSCSLAVALIINPVFCSRFLNISEKNRRKIMEGSTRFHHFQEWYGRIANRAVAHPIVTVLIMSIVVFFGFVLYFSAGKEPFFFPNMDASEASVTLEAPQGTPLEHTDSLLRVVERVVEDVPGSVDNFQSTTGRGTGWFSGGQENHKGNVQIAFTSFVDRKISARTTIDSLRERLKTFTGAKIIVEERENGPPTGNPVSYRIVGADYAVMGAFADSILRILEDYSELKLIDTDYEPAKPEVQLAIDRKKAAFYGLSTVQVAQTVRTAMHGAIVGRFRRAEDEFDINLRLSDQYRSSLRNLSDLQITGRGGSRIPVSSLASLTQQSSVGTIKRRDLQRAVEVWADFYEGVQNKAEIKSDIDTRIDALSMPKDYRIEPGEGEQFRTEATDYLAQAFLVALFLIFIVLIAQFNSIMQPIIIMVSVLLSLGGVFWGYFLSGQTFVIIMSGIGCFALAGVVVNNGIVLIDYTHIVMKDGKSWRDAIVEAAKTRLRPVLLTAITTVLGMLPMALGVSFDVHNFSVQVGSMSSQMWQPFAWAIIFGLTFATVMTLVLIPSLLSLNFRIAPPKHEMRS